MTDKTKIPGSDLFDQALTNYEQALQSGLKLQEEAFRHWTKLVSQASSSQEWPKQMTAFAEEAMPASQKNLEAYMGLLERNSRASVELLKKGIETAQATNFGGNQAKLVDFCEGSLKSLRTSAEALVELNSKAVDSWFGMVKRAAGVVDAKAEKA